MKPDAEIRTRLSRAIEDSHHQSSAQILRAIESRRRQRVRRKRTFLATSASAVLALVAVAGVQVLRAQSGNKSDSVRATNSEATVPSGPPKITQPQAAELEAAWRSLDPGPLSQRLDYASVWTGSEFIIWGGWSGSPGSQRYSDGAAYNPANNVWRPLPPAPGPGRSAAKAAWTGDEMVVIGGETASGTRSDGVAYRPDGDEWRVLSEGPLAQGLVPQSIVWTGEAVVLSAGPVEDAATEPPPIISFIPLTDEWNTLPSLDDELTDGQLAAIDGDLLFFGASLTATNEARANGVAVLRLAKSAERWSRASVVEAAPQSFAAAILGSQLAVVDYRSRARIAATPEGPWPATDSVPIRPTECSPQSSVSPLGLFIFSCGQSAILDESGAWVSLSIPAMAELGFHDTSVTASNEIILVWGRDFDRQRATFWRLDLASLR